MTLSVLACGMGLFLAALMTHVALWNIFLVRKEIAWLAFVFIVIPLAILALLYAAGLLETVFILAAGMVHLALSAVYIQTYPALREDIPSIRILMMLQANPQGLSRGQVLDGLARDQLFDTKVADLENDAFVRVRDGRMYLTNAGTILATVFLLYRKLLGSETGKG